MSEPASTKRKKRRGEQLSLFQPTAAERIAPLAPSKFSDYIVYVDESGDHSLENVDAKYPVFVLAF